MHLSKEYVDRIDATPSKRIYLSIIADYSLNTALAELVDNAYDCWNRPSKGQALRVEIFINVEQQKITVKDNAGGIPEAQLKSLISPGDSSLSGETNSIGTFGVGSKRAAVALSELIKITSRYRRLGTFQLEYDDAWLKSPSWHIEYYRVAESRPSSTEIELSNLRYQVTEEKVELLRDFLAHTYARIIKMSRVEILLNEKPVQPVFFDNWSYANEAKPNSFSKRVRIGHTQDVLNVTITGGLTLSGGSLGGDYGVFVYCNDRLIARALRGAEVGFITRIAGIPHPHMSLARIVVDFVGPARAQPWNSSKSGINYQHPVFQALQKDLFEIVKTYTALSKRLQDSFDTSILPFKNGSVTHQALGEGDCVTAGKLPKIPPAKKAFKISLAEINREVINKKPWAKGICESLIVENYVFRQHGLEQKNRIALIILDSTLEIAFKDYLANEIPQPLGDAKLESLFKDRIQVNTEVEKYIMPGDPIWRNVGYFYRQRCDLVHRRANPSISDSAIDQFRKLVQILLRKMFGLRFPAEF